MSEQNDAEYPNERSDDIIYEKFPITHRAHSSHKWGERANQRKEPRKHNRFRTVPFVEGVRLVEMSAVKYATFRIAEKLLAEFLPDPVVHGMAEDSRNREQNENKWQV